MSGESDVEVVAIASSGKLGLDRLKQFHPDVVILDAGLPDMAAAVFTSTVLADSPHTGVILLCTDDAASASQVILALEAGAFDFVLKPAGRCIAENTAPLQRLLLQKMRCFSIRRYSRIAKSFTAEPCAGGHPVRGRDATPASPGRPAAKTPASGREERPSNRGRVDWRLDRRPRSAHRSHPCPAAVFFVAGRDRAAHAQTFHRAHGGSSESGIGPGRQGGRRRRYLETQACLLAPGGSHLALDRASRRDIVLRTLDDPPENGCKPSVDVLFRSAARNLHGRVLAVVLTGMGEDGTRGLRELKTHQTRVLVQDEATSVVWGMPGSAVRAGCADEVLPLGQIAQRIGELC